MPTIFAGSRVLEGAERRRHAEKNGLCPICAETKTHKIVGKYLFKKWVAKDKERDAKGNLTIYKGYCLEPTCYTLQHVKILLGETRGPTAHHPPVDERLDLTQAALNAQNIVQPPLIVAIADVYRLPPTITTIAASAPAPASAERMDTPFLLDDSLSSLHFREFAAGSAKRTTHGNNSSSDLNTSGIVRYRPQHAGGATPRPTHGNNSSSDLDTSGSLRMDAPGAELMAHIRNNSNSSRYSFADFTTTGSGTSCSGGGDGTMSRTSGEEENEVQSSVIFEMRDAANYGDFTRLISLLERNRSKKDVIKIAFILLCKGVQEENQKQDRSICVFVNDSYVKTLNSVIADNSTDEETQVLGVSMYAYLSKVSRRYMLDIVKYGGLNIVLSTLHRYKENELTVDSCFCAFFCMVDGVVISEDSTHRQSGLTMHSKFAVKLIEGIISSIASASNSGKSWALSCLVNLCLQNLLSGDLKTVAQHVQEASGGEGITILVNAVKTGTSHTRLALSALRLLNQLCTTNNDGESYITASEELVSMILSMVSNSKDESVHEAAFVLLGSIDSNQKTFSTITLVRLSESVSALMAAYKDNEDLQVAAMLAVSKLLCPSDQRERVLEWDDLVTAILASMGAYLRNVELQSIGCLALSTIASGNESCKLAIVSNGGIAALLAAIESPAIDSQCSSKVIRDLNLYACTVFASLAACPLTRMALNEEDVVAPFMAIAQSNQTELPASVRSSVAIVIAAGAYIGGAQQQASTGFAIESLVTCTTREDAEMLISGLVDLCRRSSNVLTALMAAEGGNGISVVLRLMAQYIESLLIQEAGCEILAQVFLQFPFQGQLGLPIRLQVGSAVLTVVPHSEKELISIERAIKIHKSEGSLIAKAFSAQSAFLAGLASHDSTDIMIDDTVKQRFSGSLKACETALAVHQNNSEVQHGCLGFIRCLLLLDCKIELHRWSSRLVEHILISLRTHHEDTAIKIGACSTLLAISCAEEDDQAIASVDGQEFARLVLECMRSDSEELAEAASELVALILPQTVSLVENIVDSPDSMESIVGCLLRFVSKGVIVCNCCSILASVTTLHDSYVVPLVAQSGGVSAILDAINNHQRNEMVQESACKALMGVSRGISQKMLGKMRNYFADTTVRALKGNITSPDTEAAVLEVVWCLCSRDELFKDAFSRYNLIPSIVEVMNQNLYDRNVQGGGCTSLWSLSTFGENKEIIGTCGGLRSIINALLAHLDAIRIQKEGLTALKNLATTSQNKQLIMAYGGEHAIIFSLRANMMRSEEIIAAGFSALNNIAVDTVTGLVSRAPEHIFECILIAMRRFMWSEPVQTNACFLLKSYTFTTGNMRLIQQQSEEFITVLSLAAENFPKACGDRANYVSGRLYEGINDDGVYHY